MQLSKLLQYDLTGEKVDFKREDVRFAVFSSNQVIYLPEPAYASSIKIYQSNGTFSTKTLLAAGTHYSITGTYEASCRDFEAESFARVLFASYPYVKTADQVASSIKTYYKFNAANEQFYADDTLTAGSPIPENTYYEKLTDNWNDKLISRVQMLITGTTSSPKYLLVSYQAFHNASGGVYGDGEGPLYSPGLMRTVIERLNELERTRVKDVVAESNTFSSSLDIDLTGIKESHFIQNEKHLVDTSTDKFVIRPINGSFYKYPDQTTNGQAYMKLVFQSLDGTTTKTLKQETGDGSGDYEVIGLNYTKTAMSEPTGGVYEFIALKKALVGYVFVDYHAFGGEVSVADITQIKDDLQSLLMMMDNNGILTTDNLPKSIIIANMLDRLDFLEHQLQHYRTQTFLYTTANDRNKWVNVAYIGSNPWMSDAPIADHDVGKFQFKIEQFNTATDASQTQPGSDPQTRSSMDLELKFSYEPIRDENNAIVGLTMKVKEVHTSGTSFEEEGGAYFYKRFTPKFRIIANAIKTGETEPNFNNGLMVQMALTSQVPTKCMIVVSDKTDAKSPWTLVDTLNNERYDDSDVSKFNDATWESANANSIVSNVLQIYGNGYSIFRGAIDVTKFNCEYIDPSYMYGNETVNDDTLNRGGNNGMYLNLCALKPDIQIDAISKIRIRIYDRYTCGYIDAETSSLKEIRDSSGTNPSALTGVDGSIIYYMDDMCGISIQIRKVSTSIGSVRLLGFCGSNSAACSRFCLTGIDIL